MSRLVILLLLLIFCRTLLADDPSQAIPTAPIVARAGIVMDRNTGMSLWEYNADARLPMASTTKIMTAMVLLDLGADKLDQQVFISKTAASTGGSSLLGAGDMLTLRDVLIAALLRSSNEACMAAAEYLTDNHPALFVEMMNQKAQSLGLHNTHFVNPHGLFDPKTGAQHYSSARDLATMTRIALTQYPLIRQIVARRACVIHVTPRYPKGVLLDNHNKIVQEVVPGVPGAIVDGVKTGYIRQSGKCLVSSASLQGWQLIAVVLDGEADYFASSKLLLNYGFSRFEWKTYASMTQPGMRQSVAWGAGSPVQLAVKGVLGAPIPRISYGQVARDRVEYRGKPLVAPLKQGETVGELVLLRNGQVIAKAPAVTMQAISVVWWVTALRGTGYTLLVLLALLVFGKVYGTITKSYRRRRRRLKAARRSVYSDGTRDGEW